MASPYDTAMANPMDAAKMQAAADMLRRRETLATVGQISGDPVLGQFGAGEMGRVTGRRKSLREALSAAKKRQDCKPSGMPGQVICGGQLQEVPGYAQRVASEKEKDRAASMARAKVSGGNALSNWLARKQYGDQVVPEASWRGPSGIAQGIAQIENLKNVWESTADIPDVMKPGLDIAQETLGNIGLGSVGRWGEETFDMRSEDARGARAQAAITLDRIRNSIFGSALTSYEISEGAKSNPLASGISTPEMQNRMVKLMQYLAGSAGTMMAGRRPPGPEGSWQQPDWMDPGYQWTLPVSGGEQAPQMTPGQVPQTPGAGPGQTITPEQVGPGPVAPSQRTPQTMPQRPPKVTDEEWRQYLQLEGLSSG